MDRSMMEIGIRTVRDPKRVPSVRITLSLSTRRVKAGTPLRYKPNVGWVPTESPELIKCFCLDSHYGGDEVEVVTSGFFEFPPNPNPSGPNHPAIPLFEPGQRYQVIDVDDTGNMTFKRSQSGFLAYNSSTLLLSCLME